MKNQHRMFFILFSLFFFLLFACEAMATLFHGPKPETPPVTYTVTYTANGAIGTPPMVQTVNAGTLISLPDRGSLSSTGNIFVGWSESSGGIGTIYSVGASLAVTRDMVFFAQWLDSSTPQYTITFNPNGATSGAPPASQTVYSGTSISIPGQGTLAHSGRVFGGWNTQSNGSGTNYAAGATLTVTGNVTLYARWQSLIQYTVTYHANGAGGTVPTAQTVDPGTVITLPGAGSMSFTGRAFAGWNTQANGSGMHYEDGAPYTVNANVSFWAQWESVPVTPPGATLAEQLAYIRNDMGDGVVFDIIVNNNLFMGPTSISTMGRNITVNIRSASPASPRTIQLEGQGHLFSVDANITLRLQDIVLRGHSNNNRALVGVGSGGALVLNSGSKVTQNANRNGNQRGGGIHVNGGGLEINNGAEITENSVVERPLVYGGGIYVENGGRVGIHGGLLHENTANGNGTSPGGHGGGLFITGTSTVTMSSGIISKNLASYNGGGIFVENGSSFTKRAAPGSNTSGIIYGGTGSEANIGARFNDGHAIHRNFGTLRNRNTTLGGFDEISTGNDVGWE